MATGHVISGAARRRGAEAVTRAGRAAPRVTLYSDLARDMADRLEREGHDLAPVAREVLRDVLEHDQEKLARAGLRGRGRPAQPFDPEAAEQAARTLRD